MKSCAYITFFIIAFCFPLLEASQFPSEIWPLIIRQINAVYTCTDTITTKEHFNLFLEDMKNMCVITLINKNFCNITKNLSIRFPISDIIVQSDIIFAHLTNNIPAKDKIKLSTQHFTISSLDCSSKISYALLCLCCNACSIKESYHLKKHNEKYTLNVTLKGQLYFSSYMHYIILKRLFLERLYVEGLDEIMAKANKNHSESFPIRDLLSVPSGHKVNWKHTLIHHPEICFTLAVERKLETVLFIRYNTLLKKFLKNKIL